MKRLIVMVGIVMLFGCGMMKSGRIPAAERVTGVKEVAEARAMAVVRKHVSAFTAEDLYRSRADQLHRNRRKAQRSSDDDENTQEVTEDLVPEKSIIEIIQIVDEAGNVIAAKQIK